MVILTFTYDAIRGIWLTDDEYSYIIKNERGDADWVSHDVDNAYGHYAFIRG